MGRIIPRLGRTYGMWIKFCAINTPYTDNPLHIRMYRTVHIVYLLKLTKQFSAYPYTKNLLYYPALWNLFICFLGFNWWVQYMGQMLLFDFLAMLQGRTLGIALKWDTFSMVSIYRRTMCLEVKKPGTEVVRPQHVDEGTAEDPNKFPDRHLWGRGPSSVEERYLGLWV